VRSKAYQDTSEPGPEAARRVASRSRVVRSGADDLKRIRGIGVLTEKRLNAMGVASYEDIANWTREDIDRVSQQLDFKGRIERENWVEQARILSAGGDTEFSRRLDRRDVETSRLKT
jgi:predicted flap endonuclease-1-like 5' DNA nuclease